MAKKSKNKESGCLLGDSLPVLLTNPAFCDKATKRANDFDQKEASRAARKNANTEYKVASDEWKEEWAGRVQENKAREEEWRLEVERWEIKCDLAKQENRRQGWLKPVKLKRLWLPSKSTRRAVELENLDSDSNSSELESEGKDMSGSDCDEWCWRFAPHENLSFWAKFFYKSNLLIACIHSAFLPL